MEVLTFGKVPRSSRDQSKIGKAQNDSSTLSILPGNSNRPKTCLWQVSNLSVINDSLILGPPDDETMERESREETSTYER